METLNGLPILDQFGQRFGTRIYYHPTKGEPFPIAFYRTGDFLERWTVPGAGRLVAGAECVEVRKGDKVRVMRDWTLQVG